MADPVKEFIQTYDTCIPYFLFNFHIRKMIECSSGAVLLILVCSNISNKKKQVCSHKIEFFNSLNK